MYQRFYTRCLSLHEDLWSIDRCYSFRYMESWLKHEVIFVYRPCRKHINTILYMSRSVRKPTLWTLRKVSTRISISMPLTLTRTDLFRLLRIFCFRNLYSIPPRQNVSARISMRMLIWFDTLRRVHIVGFLVELLV